MHITSKLGFLMFYLTKMADFKEQRICIKSCFNLKKTTAETYQMLKEAFGDLAMSKSKTFLWYKRSRKVECLFMMMSVLEGHQRM